MCFERFPEMWSLCDEFLSGRCVFFWWLIADGTSMVSHVVTPSDYSTNIAITNEQSVTTRHNARRKSTICLAVYSSRLILYSKEADMSSVLGGKV